MDWLGPALVTPAIIGSYLWMWAGFAMVLIAAGLAGVPRELMEAARVDGANEWQVFRRITVPLLAPVLAVVMVTLMINVLKIFDLVLSFRRARPRTTRTSWRSSSTVRRSVRTRIWAWAAPSPYCCSCW